MQHKCNDCIERQQKKILLMHHIPCLSSLSPFHLLLPLSIPLSHSPSLTLTLAFSIDTPTPPPLFSSLVSPLLCLFMLFPILLAACSRLLVRAPIPFNQRRHHALLCAALLLLLISLPPPLSLSFALSSCVQLLPFLFATLRTLPTKPKNTFSYHFSINACRASLALSDLTDEQL